MKKFICIWGYGFEHRNVGVEPKDFNTLNVTSSVEELSFFSRDNGFESSDIQKVDGLELGFRLCLEESGELTIIRSL